MHFYPGFKSYTVEVVTQEIQDLFVETFLIKPLIRVMGSFS